MMDQVGLTRDLSKVGLSTKEDYKLIIDNVNVERL